MDIAGKRAERTISVPRVAIGYAAVAALLAAHFALAMVSNVAADLALVTAVFPIAYVTARAGPGGGIAAAAIISLAPIDSVQGTRDTIAELCAIGFASLAGVGFGLALAREEAAAAELRQLIRGRIARLRGEPGYWHTIASSRTGLYVTGIEAAFIRDSLSSGRPGVVCDIGAGSGRLEFAIAPYARAVIATEVDDDELRRMEDDYRVTPVQVGTAPVLPFRDVSLDWVIAIEVPAVSDQQWFLEECRRVLKPGGGAIVMVYNRRSYKGIVARLLSGRRASRGQIWADLYYRYPLAEHLRRWRAAGFSRVRARGFYWAPLGRASDSPLVTVAAAFERALCLGRLAAVSPWVMLELGRE